MCGIVFLGANFVRSFRKVGKWKEYDAKGKLNIVADLFIGTVMLGFGVLMGWAVWST